MNQLIIFIDEANGKSNKRFIDSDLFWFKCSCLINNCDCGGCIWIFLCCLKDENENFFVNNFLLLLLLLPPLLLVLALFIVKLLNDWDLLRLLLLRATKYTDLLSCCCCCWLLFKISSSFLLFVFYKNKFYFIVFYCNMWKKKINIVNLRRHPPSKNLIVFYVFKQKQTIKKFILQLYLIFILIFFKVQTLTNKKKINNVFNKTYLIKISYI